MARVFTFILCVLAANPGFAMGPTERACLQSERSPGQAVCACAQAVANQTLSAGDQQRAASIIRDPDEFYSYYGSKNPARKAFLERYRAWGAASSESCRRR